MKCLYCGKELVDAGCYKLECPDNCFMPALEAWQIEDEYYNEN